MQINVLDVDKSVPPDPSFPVWKWAGSWD